MARQQLREALNAGTVVGESVVVANAHLLLGQLESRQGRDLKLASDHFDKAVGVLEALDMPDRLRDCHIACAESMYERGEIDSAALHWKAAAEIGRLAYVGLRPKSEISLPDEHEQTLAR